MPKPAVFAFFASLVAQNVFGVDVPWIPGTGSSQVTPSDDAPPDQAPTEGTVPDVAGSAVDFAMSALRDAGFDNMAVEYVDSAQTGNTVQVDAEDPEAALTIRLTIELTDSGLVRAKADLTNAGDSRVSPTPDLYDTPRTAIFEPRTGLARSLRAAR